MRNVIQITLIAVLVTIGGGSLFAGDLEIGAGLEGQRTSWEENSGSGTLKVAYGWGQWSAYVLNQLGYAQVDRRVLQHLEVGAEFRMSLPWTHPFVRLGAVHQHEITSEYLSHDKTSLLGVGDGIRHRGGLALGVGTKIFLGRHERGDFYATLEATGDILAGAVGPKLSFGFGAALGFSYDFDKRDHK